MIKKIVAMIMVSTLVALILAGCSKNSTDTESSNQTAETIGTTGTIDASVYLDYSEGIEQGVYKWVLSDDKSYYVLVAMDESGEPITTSEAAINVGSGSDSSSSSQEMPDGAPSGDSGEMPSGAPSGGGPSGNGGSSTVYQGVYINSNITNAEYQTMLIYVPAEYFTTDESDNVTGINEDATVGNYTASSAPIVFQNECGGWRSSKPGACDTSYIEEGMIYVYCGARSRDASDSEGNATGKSPTQIVDLKSGVICLRANTDILPGDIDKIISVGGSGGGEMSSVLGASGNMPEYYEYMYEAGTLGVIKNSDGTYESEYDDSIYAAQCYCPIADIENADLAYAWWWVGLAESGGETYNGSTLSDFKLRLQELEADAFVEYLNSLGLKDEDGNALTLTGLRSGSYYDAILQNLSDALNSYVEAGEIDPDEEYGDYSSWLTKNSDGTYSVTDMDAFMVATGLVNNRGKDVPGFDTLDKSAENNAFGTADESAVHYSSSVAQVLSDNYEELSKLDGFDADQVDNYIEEALEGNVSDTVVTQRNLMNATAMMLGTGEAKAVDPAKYWRVRSGTSDQHTSFSIGYNICLAAQSA
ncbi:MAG: hypothetical protein IJH36_07345 [Clostridia bacterium]|nr:hypothetical protein [Clostridia bacterium]